MTISITRLRLSTRTLCIAVMLFAAILIYHLIPACGSRGGK